MKILIRDNEIIKVDERINWLISQGFTLTEADEETAEETVETAEEPAPVEETVTINGKTYTKSELKKLLE